MRYTYDSFLIDLYKRLLFKEKKSIKTDFSTAFEQRMWITIWTCFLHFFINLFIGLMKRRKYIFCTSNTELDPFHPSVRQWFFDLTGFYN